MSGGSTALAGIEAATGRKVFLKEHELLIVIHTIARSYVHLKVTNDIKTPGLLRVNGKKSEVGLGLIISSRSMIRISANAEHFLNQRIRSHHTTIVPILNDHTTNT